MFTKTDADQLAQVRKNLRSGLYTHKPHRAAVDLANVLAIAEGLARSSSETSPASPAGGGADSIAPASAPQTPPDGGEANGADSMPEAAEAGGGGASEARVTEPTPADETPPVS